MPISLWSQLAGKALRRDRASIHQFVVSGRGFVHSQPRCYALRTKVKASSAYAYQAEAKTRNKTRIYYQWKISTDLRETVQRNI